MERGIGADSMSFARPAKHRSAGHSVSAIYLTESILAAVIVIHDFATRLAVPCGVKIFRTSSVRCFQYDSISRARDGWFTTSNGICFCCASCTLIGFVMQSIPKNDAKTGVRLVDRDHLSFHRFLSNHGTLMHLTTTKII